MGSGSYFDIGIATIFAREFLEGSIVIMQYRTVILRSPEWSADGDRQKAALRCVTHSALLAALVAALVIVAVAVPLAVLSRDFDDRTAEIIEGVSKVVAAICIMQLSLKIPKWLGLYASKKASKGIGLTLREIRFNVAWNIWREVAECGAFLIPFFLGDGAIAIPFSAFVGVLISAVLAVGIWYGNKKMKDKFWLAFFMSSITFALSVGLFVGGCHEFEEVWGETKTIWEIQNDFWSHKKFPMTILYPFGYSSKRTVLQCVCFWSWTAMGALLHYCKYRTSRRQADAAAAASSLVETAEADASSSDDGCVPKNTQVTEHIKDESFMSTDEEIGGETSDQEEEVEIGVIGDANVAPSAAGVGRHSMT